tara:strand:- start:85 stop:555 length:471 start_codon:yes stop_codon:yes gene_type:complete
MKTELELDLARVERYDEKITWTVSRGVCRLLHNMGYGAITEFGLSNGRRADVFALNNKGDVVIVEIKLSVADFRGDEKWPEYMPHCNRFYFAVAEAFPHELIPQTTGLIVADRFGGAVVREAPQQSMATNLRNKEVRRFALYAANRLRRIQDPKIG